MVKPKDITADRSKKNLSISWEDGHQSIYPFSLLRYACPCAECRGGHAGMGSVPPPEVFEIPPQDTPATNLRNIEAVGNYAVMFEWEDGHHFGIYNWNYMRALCPCKICRL